MHTKKPPNRALLTTNVDLALTPTNQPQMVNFLLDFFKVLNSPTNPKGDNQLPSNLLMSFLIVAYFLTPEPTIWQIFILWFIIINKFVEWTSTKDN